MLAAVASALILKTAHACGSLHQHFNYYFSSAHLSLFVLLDALNDIQT